LKICHEDLTVEEWTSPSATWSSQALTGDHRKKKNPARGRRQRGEGAVDSHATGCQQGDMRPHLPGASNKLVPQGWDQVGKLPLLILQSSQFGLSGPEENAITTDSQPSIQPDTCRWPIEFRPDCVLFGLTQAKSSGLQYRNTMMFKSQDLSHGPVGSVFQRGEGRSGGRNIPCWGRGTHPGRRCRHLGGLL